LRRLISNSPMGKYLCRPQWIKLLLSFLSMKPCDDIELFLKLSKDCMVECRSPQPSTSADFQSIRIDATTEDQSNKGLTEIEKDVCRSILLTPGLRPRLLTVQFLESVLELIPAESSDLMEQVKFK
jgi:hypothetical protein